MERAERQAIALGLIHHGLAVNAVAEPVEATLQGPAGQAVMDQAGTDRIRFAPLGVQSWIFPAHSTMHKKRL